jgi:hypothetical protein
VAPTHSIQVVRAAGWCAYKVIDSVDICGEEFDDFAIGLNESGVVLTRMEDLRFGDHTIDVIVGLLILFLQL